MKNAFPRLVGHDVSPRATALSHSLPHSMGPRRRLAARCRAAKSLLRRRALSNGRSSTPWQPKTLLRSRSLGSSCRLRSHKMPVPRAATAATGATRREMRRQSAFWPARWGFSLTFSSISSPFLKQRALKLNVEAPNQTFCDSMASKTGRRVERQDFVDRLSDLVGDALARKALLGRLDASMTSSRHQRFCVELGARVSEGSGS